MKKIPRKMSRPKNPNDELSGIITNLRFGSTLRDAAAYKLKSNPNHKWMFSTFQKLFTNNSNFRQAVMPNPFPSSLTEVSSSTGLLAPCTYLAEIYWAAATCLQYSQKINAFIKIKSEFEKSVLLAKYDIAENLLGKAQTELGFSIWFIQNSLLHIQDVSGPEEQKRYAKMCSSTLGSHSIAAWLVHFISKRSEGNSLKNGLQEEIENFLKNYKNNPAFVSYFKSKITTHPYIQVKDIAGILYFESRSSLVDLYESLVMILQTIASDPDAPPEVLSSIMYPVRSLAGSINDPRFRNILRGLGDIVKVDESEISDRRSQAIDLYTDGIYERSGILCQEILNEDPNDIPIVKILALGACHTGKNYTEENNLLHEIINHTIKICECSEASYYSAYMLMAMVSKYYSHSWALQLKIMVHDMMSPVEKHFPSDLERGLYVHSVKISPFASLAFRNNSQKYFLSDLVNNNWASKTTSLIIKIISDEDIQDSDDPRLKKYKARKLLSEGEVENARRVFEEIYATSSGTAKFDSALYLALCHIAAEDPDRAVEVTVSTFIEQPGIVSRISFDEIGKLISDPLSWNKSICIPIFFEIYSSYHQSDKDTHLRLSFERFQEENGLLSPTDLVERLTEFRKDRVVYYLSKVCQPPVMRQTLLYDGTKEVADERIRICRALSELDPQNSMSYLDEVRERVKTQEISNGLSIVEQSMVYVDINSITKTLKSRLKDSYSKYKVLSENQRNINRDLSDLFDALKTSAPLFEKIIILPAEKDDSTSVFEVMFKEVTNEFLKSDHGLNAFLSTRIRHGKLRNLLRKSVEEETLVTSRKQVSDVYQRNEIWNQKLEISSSAAKEKILDCFDRFSKNFDNKILYILDVLLRVEVEATESIERSKAWFQYKSSALEIALIKSDSSPGDSLENFIDRCVELLWQKTDANLALVRSDLTGEIKDDFLKIFDKFSREIFEMAPREEVQHLLDAIARARTNTQMKLNTAANWFNRSVVYDRPDYNVEMVVNIATVIINNIRSGLSRNFSEHINLKAESEGDMVGRTLDGLVDLFGILFENAIDHCDLDINYLYVDVVLEFKGKVLKISMVNNVSDTVSTEAAQATLSIIKETLGKDGARKFLQAEGKSGFHKIWKILNSPFYRKPKLDFNYRGKEKFFVDIEVSVEV